MFAYFSEIITGFIAHHAYLAVLILMTLESFNFPIPSEIIMPFGGFLASKGEVNFYLIVFLGALGNLFGSLLSYFLADWILAIREKSLLLKKLLPESHLKKTSVWFKKYGTFSIFWSRTIPVIRTFISLPAGLVKMRLSVFVPFTFLGSILWSYFLTYLGFLLGENWWIIDSYFRKFDYLILALLVAVILTLLFRYIFKNKRWLFYKK